jgi:hypothetical protein
MLKTQGGKSNATKLGKNSVSIHGWCEPSLSASKTKRVIISNLGKVPNYMPESVLIAGWAGFAA